MNKKAKYTILAVVILIAISVYFISQREIEPPPAILSIGGKEQVSGIGSYCWKETLRALCVDMIGIPTAQEPLVAGSPFTAHISLPVQESPYDLYDLRLYITRAKGEDELNFSGRGWRWWKARGEKNFTLPLEHEQDIKLSLEPGLYVLNIDAWWKDIGSASYGFLVEVKANGTGVIPATEQQRSDNVSVLPAPFFPMQKEPATSYMQALLSDKPEELIIKDGCLRAGGYLLVWPSGFSVNTGDGRIQITDDNGHPVMRVGDKIKLGGGEMPGERIAQYSSELPNDRCSGSYWIVGEVITVDKSTSLAATTPALKSAPSQYFPGQAFDEGAGNLT
ncbi:MAG: hypothetical protein FIB07_01090 [Candidatus Methanoperedens sp.]|nr:hypothetical protein [Candidatus Methanoperedens sp.]